MNKKNILLGAAIAGLVMGATANMARAEGDEAPAPAKKAKHANAHAKSGKGKHKGEAHKAAKKGDGCNGPNGCEHKDAGAASEGAGEGAGEAAHE